MEELDDELYAAAQDVLSEYEAVGIPPPAVLRFLNAAQRNLQVLVRKVIGRSQNAEPGRAMQVLLDVVRDRVALLNDLHEKANYQNEQV